jgi:cytochrome c oxidase subunit II
MTTKLAQKLRLILCLFCFSSFLSAEPMHAVGNIFRPLATPGELVADVSILTLIICLGVFLIVGGLLFYAVIRFGYRDGDSRSEPAQVYGSNQVEIAWTVVPILIVFVLSMATARITSAVQDQKIPKDALTITVVGHQWWWEFKYDGMNIVAANEMHVPVSSIAQPRITLLKLESADVAHGFWVPQLAGKTDVIPNRENTMWIDPKETGIYLGNCSEYCGTQHAKMELRVVVDTPEEFMAWVSHQQAKALPAESAENQKAFLASTCFACHTVSGTRALGKLGPDLMSRQTLAATEVPLTPETLRDWIRDPQKLKPGNKMPAVKVGDEQLNQMVAYLASLK